MQNKQDIDFNQNSVLSEIFMAPSPDIIENRFVVSAEQACCDGNRCKSGGGCCGLV